MKVAGRIILIISVLLTMSVIATSCGSSRKAVSLTETTAGKSRDRHKTDYSKKDRHHGPAAGHSLAQALVDEARTWLGTPYRYGGKDKSGTDCSGFIMQLYKDVANVSVPRNSRAQWDYCEGLDKKDLAVGDLVFFSSKNSDGEIAHVGMYIGNNSMIHASSSRGVIETNLDGNYYIRHFIGAGRLPVIAQILPVPRPVTPVEPLPAPEPMPVASVPEPAPTEPETIVFIAEPIPIEPVQTEPIQTVPVQTVQKPEPDSPDKDPAPSPAVVVKNAFGRTH